MKLGYKIAIGTIIGFGAGYGIWRIIYNSRLNKAEATKQQQKDMLITNILLLRGLPDNDTNRAVYNQKSLEDLNAIYKSIQQVNEPLDTEYEMPPVTIPKDNSYSDYLTLSDSQYYSNY
jgi:hypothetical protein